MHATTTSRRTSKHSRRPYDQPDAMTCRYCGHPMRQEDATPYGWHIACAQFVLYYQQEMIEEEIRG